jgi:NAD+ dependent glucose-6-phosphate dehydrogenase
MRVLVTGDSGRVGQVVVADLSRDHEVSGFSSHAFRHPGGVVSAEGDIADRAALSRAMGGVDAVVHLAGDPRPEAPWPSVLHANIDGTYQVFEAARRASVPKVVYASSNHVTGLHTEQGSSVDTGMAVAPDSLYAVSKVTGEALGRLYGERYGMSVVCLRIGYLNEEDDPYVSLPESNGPRPSVDALAGMWISHRDLAQLVRRSVVAEDVRFGIFYGTSANAGSSWDISDARSVLGYEPLDDSAQHTHQAVRVNRSRLTVC